MRRVRLRESFDLKVDQQLNLSLPSQFTTEDALLGSSVITLNTLVISDRQQFAEILHWLELRSSNPSLKQLEFAGADAKFSSQISATLF